MKFNERAIQLTHYIAQNKEFWYIATKTVI